MCVCTPPAAKAQHCPSSPLLLQPVDMSGSEADEGDDEDGFLSDLPVDTPLELAHVEIEVGKAMAENKATLEVDNIAVELRNEEMEAKSQPAVEPLASSSPVAAKPVVDQAAMTMGDFTAEIMGIFATKNTEQTSSQEGLVREQPQAPSLEDGQKQDQTHKKDDSQTGQYSSYSKHSKFYWRKSYLVCTCWL